MKAFLFLITLNFVQVSGASVEPIQELGRLYENYANSPSFQIWHDRKDELETSGFKIWTENSSRPEFCSKLSSLPNDIFDTLVAWEAVRPTNCSEIVHQGFRTRRIQTQLQLPTSSFFSSLVELEPCDRTRSTIGPLGPTREVILDTTGGPRLVHGELRKCELAFTFDDGPHPYYSKELLLILEAQSIKANFFSVGQNVDRHSEVINSVAKAGHVVGNHSYSHKNLPKLSYSAAKAEIIGGFNSLLKLWDYTTPFFRFPYGAFTKKTRSFIQSKNVAEFFWNMDTLDWKLKDPSRLYRNVIKEINREKRGILLFHDVHPQTIDIMPDVLNALKRAGYTTAVFVPEDLIEAGY